MPSICFSLLLAAPLASPAQEGLTLNVRFINQPVHNASDMELADLDLDGTDDLAFTGSSSKVVGWLPGLGAGAYGPPRFVDTDFQRALVVGVGDLDGDGRPDLVAGASSHLSDPGGLRWYRNLGGGDFGPRRELPAPVGVSHLTLAVGDADGDGDVDIVTSDFPDGMGLYENQGNGQFAGPFAPANLGSTGQPQLADQDADGVPDVVLRSGLDDVYRVPVLPGGQFGVPVLLTDQEHYARSLRLADLDGDGLRDLVVHSEDTNDLAWYRALGAGALGPRQVLTTAASNVRHMEAGDADGDGDLDLFLGSDSFKRISWLENQGGGTFAPLVHVAEDLTRVQGLALGDADGDGDDEALLALSDLDAIQAVDWDASSGSFSEPYNLTAQVSSLQAMAQVDLDGDGAAEVLAASTTPPGLRSYAVLGGGQFGPAVPLPQSPARVLDVVPADLDGDGDPDLLCGLPSPGGVAWLENLGGGAFAPAVALPAPTASANRVLARDMDQDGLLDVLSVHTAANRVVWCRGLGGGAFGPAQFLLAGPNESEPVALDVGNQDGDPWPDLVVGYASSAALLWTGTASGPAGQGVLAASLGDLTDVHLADLSGDGSDDLLLAGSPSGAHRVRWHESAFQGVFFGGLNVHTFERPQRLLAADVNGDGALDLLSAQRGPLGSGAQQTVLAISDGQMPQPDFTTQTLGGPSGAEDLALWDLDLDGDLDLVLLARNHGTLTWHRRDEELGVSYCSATNNSSGGPAITRAYGAALASSGTIVLRTQSTAFSQFGLFLASQTQGFTPFAGGSSGHLCLGGAIGRSAVQGTGNQSLLVLELPLHGVPSPSGTSTVLPGQTWSFQSWFRDTGPSGPTSNFSLPVAVTFF